MFSASELRREAREALRGKWTSAVIAGIIASMLGAVSSSGPELSINLDAGQLSADLKVAGQAIFSTDGGLNLNFGPLVLGALSFAFIAAVVFAVAMYILGSVIAVGYAEYNLDLVDGGTPALRDMFSAFPKWKTAAVARLLQTLYIFLWSLLLVIPGIIASYSYSMTKYIIAENPWMSANEAIAKSKELMRGNRWCLFVLRLSFIGWDLLCLFTLGIGNLWLLPYKQAAEAAFYREITTT